MVDFKVIDVPGKLARSVRSFDENGDEIDDDGGWHRHVIATDFVLAEFLVHKHMVADLSAVERRSDLVLMWSQLTPHGQAFVRALGDKWLRSIDRIGTTEATMLQKLERRWRAFSEADA